MYGEGSHTLYHLAYMCLAVSFRLKCTTMCYVYSLCWVCKWICVWYIYLFDDYFSTPGQRHFSSRAFITALIEKKKAAFEMTFSLKFNTCSFCHFLSASHGIGNYSALVCMEPGRLEELLPSSWMSHSNKSKWAVTTRLGLGTAAVPKRLSWSRQQYRCNICGNALYFQIAAFLSDEIQL